MQGCTTSITLGASSSKHSGTRKASGVKLSGDTTRTHTYIYMSHTQIKRISSTLRLQLYGIGNW